MKLFGTLLRGILLLGVTWGEAMIDFQISDLEETVATVQVSNKEMTHQASFHQQQDEWEAFQKEQAKRIEPSYKLYLANANGKGQKKIRSQAQYNISFYNLYVTEQFEKAKLYAQRAAQNGDKRALGLLETIQEKLRERGTLTKTQDNAAVDSLEPVECVILEAR